VPAKTSFTTFAASFLLTGQEVSLMRHCARVSVQPQSQLSEFKRLNAIFLWSSFIPLKSTPGSSVASEAFFKKI
jgi:hypothetical protein